MKKKQREVFVAAVYIHVYGGRGPGVDPGYGERSCITVLTSFTGPTKRGESLAHTACTCVQSPWQHIVGKHGNMYDDVQYSTSFFPGSLVHVQAACSRPSPLS